MHSQSSPPFWLTYSERFPYDAKVCVRQFSRVISSNVTQNSEKCYILTFAHTSQKSLKMNPLLVLVEEEGATVEAIVSLALLPVLLS